MVSHTPYPVGRRNASRIPPGRVIWVVGWVGKLLGCLSFAFISVGNLGCHFRCPWAILGSILGALGPFWKLWLSLGLHFGGSRGALGSIFGTLGVQWVALGVLGGSLGRPG